MSTSSSTPKRKSLILAADKRQTNLGTFVPQDGDFLYINGGHIWRILISSTPGVYDVRDAATDRLVKSIDEATARNLIAKHWDVYQRVVT